MVSRTSQHNATRLVDRSRDEQPLRLPAASGIATPMTTPARLAPKVKQAPAESDLQHSIEEWYFCDDRSCFLR